LGNFLAEHLIHRDEDFMVIHKPSGILSVPGKGEALSDSVLTRLVAIEPKTLLIHRLDRDTSGILVFGLSRRGQNSIARQFQERQTTKTYQALVAGHLQGEGTVDVPVVYDPAHPPLHIADAHHNKPALTHWQAIEQFEINGSSYRSFASASCTHAVSWPCYCWRYLICRSGAATVDAPFMPACRAAGICASADR